jgi:hypothetical protein
MTEDRGSCPYIRSASDGTHWCELAESHHPWREPAALLTTWVSETEAVTEPLFKVPPPARRLTDSEIGEIWFAARIPGLTETDGRRLIRAAEARLGVR